MRYFSSSTSWTYRLVELLLHFLPNFVVSWVQMWTVWRLCVWWNESGHFPFPNADYLVCPVFLQNFALLQNYSAYFFQISFKSVDTLGHVSLFPYTPGHVSLFPYTLGHLSLFPYTPGHLSLFPYTPGHVSLFPYTPGHVYSLMCSQLLSESWQLFYYVIVCKMFRFWINFRRLRMKVVFSWWSTF